MRLFLFFREQRQHYTKNTFEEYHTVRRRAQGEVESLSSLGDRARWFYTHLPWPLRAAAQGAYSLVPFPWRFGWTFARLHQRFWRSQYLDRAALERLQLKQLRQLARYVVATVPAYRELFSSLGLRPDDIRSLDDWRQLPLTTKESVRCDPRRYCSDAVPAHRVRRHTTSGSTGTPLVIHSTREAWMAESAMMVRGWRWAGFQPGDRMVTCVGEIAISDAAVVAPYGRYRNRIDISPHHLSEEGCRGYAELVRTFEPRFIRTYPSIAILLGEQLRSRGIRLRSLRGILTQSESMPGGDRARIESLWGAPVRDFYGMQEKCVAMSECEYGTMHVHSEFGHVELEPTATPPHAQIIATGFWNRAMPLIRYATGDLAIAEPAPCRCGRSLPRIKRLIGRVEDFIYASDGRPVIEIDVAVASIPGIRQCQLVQRGLRDLLVRVVPDPRFDEAAERRLVQGLRDQLGADVEVTVRPVSRLERTASGKQRFIICRIEGPPT